MTVETQTGPNSQKLLERAYELMEAQQTLNAELVLDMLVRSNPQNVEAWEAYMQLHRDRSDLEWLRERVLHTPELSDADKKDIIAYQEYLVRKIDEEEQARKAKENSQKEDAKPELDESGELIAKSEIVAFELLEEFNFSRRPHTALGRNAPPSRRRTSEKQESLVPQAFVLFVFGFIGAWLSINGWLVGYWLLLAFMLGAIYLISNWYNSTSPRDADKDDEAFATRSRPQEPRVENKSAAQQLRLFSDREDDSPPNKKSTR